MGLAELEARIKAVLSQHAVMLGGGDGALLSNTVPVDELCALEDNQHVAYRGLVSSDSDLSVAVTTLNRLIEGMRLARLGCCRYEVVDQNGRVQVIVNPEAGEGLLSDDDYPETWALVGAQTVHAAKFFLISGLLDATYRQYDVQACVMGSIIGIFSEYISALRDVEIQTEPGVQRVNRFRYLLGQLNAEVIDALQNHLALYRKYYEVERVFSRSELVKILSYGRIFSATPEHDYDSIYLMPSLEEGGQFVRAYMTQPVPDRQDLSDYESTLSRDEQAIFAVLAGHIKASKLIPTQAITLPRIRNQYLKVTGVFRNGEFRRNGVLIRSAVPAVKLKQQGQANTVVAALGAQAGELISGAAILPVNLTSPHNRIDDDHNIATYYRGFEHITVPIYDSIDRPDFRFFDNWVSQYLAGEQSDFIPGVVKAFVSATSGKVCRGSWADLRAQLARIHDVIDAIEDQDRRDFLVWLVLYQMLRCNRRVVKRQYADNIDAARAAVPFVTVFDCAGTASNVLRYDIVQMVLIAKIVPAAKVYIACHSCKSGKDRTGFACDVDSAVALFAGERINLQRFCLHAGGSEADFQACVGAYRVGRRRVFDRSASAVLAGGKGATRGCFGMMSGVKTAKHEVAERSTGARSIVTLVSKERKGLRLPAVFGRRHFAKQAAEKSAAVARLFESTFWGLSGAEVSAGGFVVTKEHVLKQLRDLVACKLSLKAKKVVALRYLKQMIPYMSCKEMASLVLLLPRQGECEHERIAYLRLERDIFIRDERYGNTGTIQDMMKVLKVALFSRFKAHLNGVASYAAPPIPENILRERANQRDEFEGVTNRASSDSQSQSNPIGTATQNLAGLLGFGNNHEGSQDPDALATEALLEADALNDEGPDFMRESSAMAVQEVGFSDFNKVGAIGPITCPHQGRGQARQRIQRDVAARILAHEGSTCGRDDLFRDIQLALGEHRRRENALVFQDAGGPLTRHTQKLNDLIGQRVIVRSPSDTMGMDTF